MVTFTVQESVNGISWTTLRTHTAPPTVYTQFTDNPQAASRYIRFYYTQKVTGNIGVDDVNLAVAPAGPQQEINVKFNNVSIASGSTIYFNSPVSTSTPIILSIENLGTTNALTVSATNFSGPQAAEYTIQSAPTNVNALSNSNLVFDFLPTSSGTRLATLTITNNDANEPSYVINLYGIGGSFATEPTASASNLSFGTVKSYRFSPSYTAANPAPDGGYLVLRKKGVLLLMFR